MEFYASVFGGTLSLSTFAEFGAKDSPDADRIMHGMLETDAGYTIMAADITSDMKYHPMAGFSVGPSADDDGALRGYWEKLSTSGTTTMPVQKQIWGDEFGICVDKFGVSWLVDISQPQAWQLIRAHGRPTLPGDAGAVQGVRAIDTTPVRRRRQGVLGRPPAPSRPGHRSPHPTLRHASAPQFARPGSVMDERLRKMDTEEQRSALRAAV